MTQAIEKTLTTTILQTHQLTRQFDIQHLPSSSKKTQPANYFLGQERAKQALEIGINMPFSGYHICAIGIHGLGKRQTIERFLQEQVQPNTPIIYEGLPTLPRLFGQIIHQADHSYHIIQGSLLKANHGYLILELEQLLQYPNLWPILKFALKTQQWQWSSIQHLLKQPLPNELAQQSVALNLKVILLSKPDTYDDLLTVDHELSQLFKIRADFTEFLQRNTANELAFIDLIAEYAQQDHLLTFNRQALAAVLTEASHFAEDQNALSLHHSIVRDLLREAHHQATLANAKIVTEKYVQQALQQRLYRLGYWRELYWQDLSQGTQLIETQGQRLGQVNALSVIQYADIEFGFPSRLTASVCQGAGDILDIERSVELGGSLHAKGTLLMSSFLKSHFGRHQILNFSAALAFEQSYGEVDGDSATVAELSALISAISQIPIHQSWAITGSMNQLGQVQPVGGINAKIEGFFDACLLQGLTGQQGVIIPRQNIQHLMLRQDIINAVNEQKFHIHAIDNIEQALEILMGCPVGEPNNEGQYSEGSIYAAVMKQLALWQESEEILVEDEPKKSKKKKKSKKAIKKITTEQNITAE